MPPLFHYFTPFLALLEACLSKNLNADHTRAQIENHLAGHIKAVQESGHPVAWVCDPMHGKYVYVISFLFSVILSDFFRADHHSDAFSPRATPNCSSRPIHPHPTTPHSTHTSTTGLKTRNFSSIISELTSCLRIHAANSSRLGGVSLEFTGEVDEEGFSVTECLGGSMELAEEELGLRYQVWLIFHSGTSVY